MNDNQPWRTNFDELIELAPPLFNEQRLLRCSDVISALFLKHDVTFLKNVSVDLNKVIGIDQPYNNKTWNDILNGQPTQRESVKNRAVTDTEYYLQDRIRYPADWSFSEIEGVYFMANGKHRTVTARYLAHYNPEKFPDGPIFKGFTVKRYSVDTEMMERYQSLTASTLKGKFHSWCLRHP